MKRDYANRGPGHKNRPSETRTGPPGTSREIQLSLVRDELLGLMQDSLEALAVELGRRLSEAYHETDYATAKASLEGTARWLDRLNADAAASLREGLEETLTVVRLGVPGALRRTLATTNPIESALRVTRRVTARVTRWRDGHMRRRWCAAGLLRAEAKFRRVKGHRAMPVLLKALEAVVRGDRVESGGPVRENARRNHTFASRAETPPCKRERL